MNSLWLTRVRLRRDAPVATLAATLLPTDANQRVTNVHRLMWSLFSCDDLNGGTQDKRRFLWREAENGMFYVLSQIRPPETHPLLDVDEPKVFAPALAAGVSLRFSLRANPTVARPLDTFRERDRDPALRKSRRTAHDDIVMRAIRSVSPGDRAEARRKAIAVAGRAWLVTQGLRHGFQLPPAPAPEADATTIDPVRIDGYQVLRPPHAPRKGEMRIATLDYDGILTVTDPDRFVAALARGFGRAKAYGCGLMLIARA